MIFLFLFLGNFSMGAKTYSHHCISVLQKHIYVTRCKWNRFDKSDSHPIWENAWSGQV